MMDSPIWFGRLYEHTGPDYKSHTVYGVFARRPGSFRGARFIGFSLPFFLHGRLNIIRFSSNGYHTYTKYIQLNPYHSIAYAVAWRWEVLRAKMKGTYESCACGEGNAVWLIKDPNKPETAHIKRWRCCKRCVCVYDFHMTRRAIQRAT